MSNTYLDNFVISPLWAQAANPERKKRERVIKVLKIILKFSKLIIYAFLFLMGLWGCFQTMVDPTVKTSTTIGSGMEFGFSFGTTGDYRYDLTSGSNTDYYTFTPSYWNISNYGPFFSLFVYPGAMLVLYIMYPLRDAWGGLNALLGIFVLLFIIRIITFLISIRSTLQSERMSEIQGKIAEINAKYKDVKKDMAMRQRKQAETQEVYKKYKIKPFAMFEQLFVTMPIFLIVYRVVTILRPIKVINLFSIWSLAASPLTEITSHFSDSKERGWIYIFFLLIIVPTQVLSQKIPQILARRRNKNAKTLSQKGDASAKRMRITQTIILVVLVFIVVQSPTSVGLYWFLSSLFTIAQSFIIHKYVIKKRKKGISLEDKLRELGIT